MAKKIYIATLANGTVQEVSTKKAVKALEGIVSVTLDGQDITNEFVKEDKVMAENKNIAIEAEAQENEYVGAVEAIEAVEEAQAEVEALEAPAGPKATLLFTASRGNAKRLSWKQVIVNPEDELVKVKGCAALLPTPVAEAIGSSKFVTRSRLRSALPKTSRSVAWQAPSPTSSTATARLTNLPHRTSSPQCSTSSRAFSTTSKQV